MNQNIKRKKIKEEHRFEIWIGEEISFFVSELKFDDIKVTFTDPNTKDIITNNFSSIESAREFCKKRIDIKL